MEADGYIAQWLERLTADQQVPGSNPGVPFTAKAKGGPRPATARSCVVATMKEHAPLPHALQFYMLQVTPPVGCAMPLQHARAQRCRKPQPKSVGCGCILVYEFPWEVTRTCTCGLVAMASAPHAEGCQFDPGQV